MIPVSELRDENRQINDLRQVLAALVEDEAMHKNGIFCELLERFQAKLNLQPLSHLNQEASRCRIA